MCVLCVDRTCFRGHGIENFYVFSDFFVTLLNGCHEVDRLCGIECLLLLSVVHILFQGI